MLAMRSVILENALLFAFLLSIVYRQKHPKNRGAHRPG